METVTISTVLFGKIIWMLLCLMLHFIYTIIWVTIAFIRQWPHRKALKKFKKICKLKHTSVIKQECIIIEKFVEEYENKKMGKNPTEIIQTEIPKESPKEPPKDSEPKWYPNGWYYDERKEKWIPPDYRYMKDGKFIPDYQAEHGAKSPTGWTYDRDTMKWDPPKELIEENKRRWKWDPEKKIWIDLKKRPQGGNLVYNEQVRMWVSKDQCDPVENQRRYEENRKHWQEYEERERLRQQTRQRVEAILKESNIEELYFGQYDRYSDFTDEELKLILQTKQSKKEPSYEEWKAAREKKLKDEQEHPEE